MKEAYDFTFDLLGVVLNCSMILAVTFLIGAFIVIICACLKDFK